MLLTGQQLWSLGLFADGTDCNVTKLGGANAEWAKAKRADGTVAFIQPNGQITDKAPAKRTVA